MSFVNLQKSGFLLLFILGGVFYLGAEPFSLSLEEAVNRGVAESITLKKNVMDLELAQYKAEHLWSELFPGFSLRGALTALPATPLLTQPGFSFNQDGVSYSLSFGISLQFNGGIPASMKLTRLAYQKGLLDYESAQKRVEIDISKLFLNLLAGQENISNLKEILDLADRQHGKNSVARANGLIGELAWLQSRLSAETARYNLSNAQGNYENALKDFLTTLGLDRDADVVLEGSITASPVDLDPEAMIQEYLVKRPDMVAQRQTIEGLELAQKQGAFSSKAPSLSLSAQWSGGPGRGDGSGGGLGGPFSDSLSGSLSLSVPIDPWIPGTRSNQSLKTNDNELEKAQLDLINTETAAKSQIRSFCESLKNSWKSIEIARLGVEIARRTHEISETGFQSGTVEFLILEDTRNDLADARYRLLQSELIYHNTLLDLAAALNVDMETLIRSGE